MDSTALFRNIEIHAGSQSYPPVDKWEPDFCGDIDIRIDADAVWHYHGSPIGRSNMVRLFSSVLRLDDDGHYYLVTPVEKLRIQVDDAPYVVKAIDVCGEGELQKIDCVTHLGERFALDADHPLSMGEAKLGGGAPYVLFRKNLKAKMVRNVYYECAALARPRSFKDSKLGLWSYGEFFPLEPNH